MSDSVHIVMIEPSEIICEGLRSSLRKQGLRAEFSELSTPEEIASLSDRMRIDVILLNPVFVQQRRDYFFTLKEAVSGSRWIALVYSFFDEEILSLFDAVIKINDSPASIEKLITGLQKKDTSGEAESVHQLTDREIEVLKLLVAGFSNKEIAEKLYLSIHTVISHRKNITQKTGVKSLAGLTILAVAKKLVRLEPQEI